MLSLFLKVCNVGAHLMSTGNLFHSVGAEKHKFYGVRIMNRNMLLLHVKLNVPVEYYCEY